MKATTLNFWLSFFTALMAIAAPSLARAEEETPFCVNLNWWKSADSSLTAVQENKAVRFASINGKDLLFHWIPGSESPPFPGGQHDENFKISRSKSRSCFPRSYLRIGKNLFKFMFFWGSSDSVGTAEGTMYLNNGAGEIFLCRDLIQGGTTGNRSCQGELELELSQIDPEVASKLERLAAVNEKLAKELEGLRSNYASLKAFMDALEKRVDKLGASLFDVLTEADFIGHERELNEVIELIRSHKASATALGEESKKTLEGAKAEADAVKKAFEDILSREGATINDVTVAVPEVTDLEVDIPQPEDQTDPFDPANDPYAQIAKATIDLIERSWPDKRFEILLIINAWNQKQKDVEAALAARSRISAAEMKAYYESVNKVKAFILETGCGGNGCLSEDGWFKDSAVPSEVRRSLKAELRTIDPIKSELLEEQMRTWQRDEINQQKILAAVQALSGAARTLSRLAVDDSAYLRGRLDAILSSTLTAAKNGACVAGTLAPGVNDFADWYEMVEGKDVCTGDSLAIWEQALSGVGLIAGSGRLWRTMAEEISGLAKVAHRTDELVAGATYVKRYGPIELGPLHKIPEGKGTVADTFRGASYWEVVTKEETVLYRVYDSSKSSTNKGLGAYWSRTKPMGPLQAQLDSAINPGWGTVPKAWVAIKVPTGTKIYEGIISPQAVTSVNSTIPLGELYGGGSQIYFDFRVKEDWILKGVGGTFP
jgi:hypothetical protein